MLCLVCLFCLPSSPQGDRNIFEGQGPPENKAKLPTKTKGPLVRVPGCYISTNSCQEPSTSNSQSMLFAFFHSRGGRGFSPLRCNWDHTLQQWALLQHGTNLLRHLTPVVSYRLSLWISKCLCNTTEAHVLPCCIDCKKSDRSVGHKKRRTHQSDRWKQLDKDLRLAKPKFNGIVFEVKKTIRLKRIRFEGSTW